MHEYINFLVIALVVLGYGYFSKLLLRYNISGPMIFVAVGVFLSPLGVGPSETKLNAEVVQIVAEFALIIILFSDASALNLKKLRGEWSIPVRLLFISLPITIIAATLMAQEFFPEETTAYLLLMALILAPTDAALGKAVVTDKTVPEKIRSGINVESGLNDGIVLPVLLTVVVMIMSGQEHAKDNSWIGYVAQQIIFGGLIGSAVGYISARLSLKVIQNDWMESNYHNLVPIALAILAYYLAEYFGGNGFIAAFFAGLFVGNYSEDLREHVEDFAESEGDLLILISFLVFGIAFIPPTIDYWDLNVFVYSLLSLTVLRMVPVAISMIGTKFDLSTILFIGWFGPRGIASILYVLIVINQLGPIKGHETIYSVISLTILLSIILHGLSAQSFARLYAKKHKNPE
ncbi:MAG: cation:proton antiporter [Sulfurimonadaceae bacterium]